ncbi:MAG: Sjogren's syndrome/scleroderma autoantigen 1 family protein [Halobacteriaceae archaeon]
MSDSDDSGFDREAERERLREKYENDQEDREQTQRMSELLLQGATMTNKHCDTCGNPIFRYDGQEFCPVCQQPGTESTAAAPEAPEAEQRTEPVDAERTDQPTVEDQSGTQPREAPSAPPEPSDDLAAGRSSLETTLARMARQAERTDDPRQARDYLDAARSAAQALAALDDRR